MAEYHRATITIIALALQFVGSIPQRLTDLIGCMGPATPDATTQLRERLNTFTREEHDQQARLSVWNSLRATVNNHRSFQDAEWALPEQELHTLRPHCCHARTG